jgi:hypothetical protein
VTAFTFPNNTITVDQWVRWEQRDVYKCNALMLRNVMKLNGCKHELCKENVYLHEIKHYVTNGLVICTHHCTESVGLALTLSDFCLGGTWFESRLFMRFPQSMYASAGILPELGHDRFLPSHF